jgi:hypothetical protein
VIVIKTYLYMFQLAPVMISTYLSHLFGICGTGKMCVSVSHHTTE